MDVPIEIYQEILEYSDFLIQIRLTQVSKYFHTELRIRDFYNINGKYLRILTDNILQNYKHITKLYASDNKKITDAGIKCLNLHTLNATYNEGGYIE